MHETDSDLVNRSLKGDAVAFGLLIQRYYNVVYHLAFRVLKNYDDAIDLTQDTFVEAFQSLKQLREPAKFSSWIRGIAYNLCKMHLRSQKEMLPLEMIDDDIIEQYYNLALTRPDEECEKIELQDMMIKSLQLLSENNRLVLKLYFMDGKSYKEIASFLSVSTSAIRSRLHRAMNNLREEMADMTKDAFAYKPKRATSKISINGIIIDQKGVKYTKIASLNGKNDIVITLKYPFEISMSPNNRFVLNGSFVVPLDGQEPFDLVDDIPTLCCTWSPDGKKVAFFSKGALMMISVSSETGKPLDKPKIILDTEYKSIYPNISWSPDSDKIAFPRTAEHDLNRIWTISINDKKLTKIADDPIHGFHNASWSPDGKKIAYYGGNLEEGRTLWVSSSDGGNMEIVLNVERDNLNCYPIWSPDSNWLFHYTLDWRLKAVRLSDRHVIDIKIPDEVGYFLSYTPDKKMVFYNQSYDHRTSLRMVSSFGGDSCELGKNLTLWGDEKWSPDSKMIITQGEDKHGNMAFWVIPTLGTKPIQLKLEDALPSAMPCSVSPDCEKALFSVKSDQKSEDLWVVPISAKDGKITGEPILVFKDYNSMFRWYGMYQWSSDSTKIAVYNCGIWIAHADGSDPIQITEDFRRGTRSSYRWSPDGNMISFIPYAQKGFELNIIPSLGGEKRKLIDIGRIQYSWSPDGREIACLDENNILVVVSIDDGYRRLLDPDESEQFHIADICWSPDGKQIAFAGRKYDVDDSFQIYAISSQGGIIRQITNDRVSISYGQMSSPCWSPDGRWIAYSLNGYFKTRPECTFWAVDAEELLRQLPTSNEG